MTDDHGQMTEAWRFVLEAADGDHRFVAGDVEPGTRGERLELLAVVRGLEALDQPSRVTLVTKSRYVSRGLRCGLEAWRDSGWQWERFGKLVPVKNFDLWQRVDRALKFHRVECRRWRIDDPHRRKRAGALRHGQPSHTHPLDPESGAADDRGRRHKRRTRVRSERSRPTSPARGIKAWCRSLARQLGRLLRTREIHHAAGL